MSPTSQQNAHTLSSQLLAALTAAKAITPQQVQDPKLNLGAPEALTPIPKQPNPAPNPALSAASNRVSVPGAATSGVEEVHSVQPQISLENQLTDEEPPQNPAVLACIRAWARKEKELEGTNVTMRDRRMHAEQAYRMAMPPLEGRQNIRNFIACVTRGMLNGAISFPAATKYLYAAQVAHAASEAPARQPARQPGRPRTQPSEASTPPSS